MGKGRKSKNELVDLLLSSCNDVVRTGENVLYCCKCDHRIDLNDREGLRNKILRHYSSDNHFLKCSWSNMARGVRARGAGGRGAGGRGAGGARGARGERGRGRGRGRGAAVNPATDAAAAAVPVGGPPVQRGNWKKSFSVKDVDFMPILYIRKYLTSHLFYCYVKILADPEVRLRLFMRTVHARYVFIHDNIRDLMTEQGISFSEPRECSVSKAYGPVRNATSSLNISYFERS